MSLARFAINPQSGSEAGPGLLALKHVIIHLFLDLARHVHPWLVIKSQPGAICRVEVERLRWLLGAGEGLSPAGFLDRISCSHK